MRNLILSNTISLFDFWLAIGIPFLVYKGVTLEQALALVGLYNLLCTVFEYPTGVVGDYFGHKTSIVLGNMFVLASYSVLLFAQSYTVLLLALALRGLGISLKSGSTESLLKAHSSNYKQQYGKLASLEDAAIFSASVVSGFIAQISYEFVMLVSIGLTILSTVFMWRVPEAPTDPDEKAPSGNIFALAHEGIRFSLRNRTVLILILLISVFFGYGRNVKVILSVATEHFDFAIQYLGLLIGAGMFTRSIGKYVFSKFETVSMSWVAVLFFLLVSGTVFSSNPWIFTGSIILANGLMGVLLSWTNTQLAEAASNRVRASVISFSNLMSRLGSSMYIFAFSAILTGSSIHWAMLTTLCVLVVSFGLGSIALQRASKN